MLVLRYDVAECLPPGVRVAHCRRFAGLCLEAARPFAAGETVVETRVVLVSLTTTVVMATTLGDVVVTAENVLEPNDCDHGYPIHPDYFPHYAPALVRRFAELCDLPKSDTVGVCARLTDDGARPLAIAVPGDLINHASRPNMIPQIDRFERLGDGTLLAPYVALSAIAPGEELTFDYRSYVPALALPAHWV